MPKVLTIAYDFPPRRTSGVYRTVTMTRYLQALGWQSTVLSVEARPGDLADDTLLRDFPAEIRIKRTRDLNISAWEKQAEKGIRAAGGLRSHYRDVRQPVWDQMIRSAGHLLRSFAYFPDDTVGWIPGALTRAVELHMQARFDVLYTTSPPRSAPVVGMVLRDLFGVPWVAEYRDPWYPPPRPWRRRSERALLHRLLQKADRVVTVSKALASDFEESYSVPKTKLATINNGYEEDDFAAVDGQASGLLASEYFHFSHFGTIYPGFSGRFFDGLRELLRESPELKDRILVNVIGFPDETVRQEAMTDDLQHTIQMHGFVDHATAVTAMRSSDCLLLFLANRELARLAVAGKTYEYLRAGRPILAISYDGDTMDLIKESQSGRVVNPDDVQAIKQALRATIADGRRSRVPTPRRPEFVAQFRYDRLAANLADVFQSALTHDK